MLDHQKSHERHGILRILIVDDSPHFIEAARSVLGGDGLTVVESASTSTEAVELAQILRPDVILVDVDLGAESGFDLADQLMVLGDTPVVMISVDSESELRDLLEASQAVGFVTKSELSLSAVSRVLGRDSA
jgi:CheY-like chemotaxis protein